MSYREEVLRRIAFLQAELAAVARLVELDATTTFVAPPMVAAPAPAPAVAAPAPAPAPAAVEAPAPAPEEEAPKGGRWSYLSGAMYRISGANPFRSDGNNFSVFNHLVDTFGSKPFTREDLTAVYEAMKADGTITTDQSEDSFVKVFLRQGGVERGRLAMVSGGQRSGPTAAAAPAAPAPAPAKAAAKPVTRTRRAAAPATAPAESAEDALPPEAGEDASGKAAYRLKGTPRFRGESINKAIFETLGRKQFTRKSLNELVRAMVADGRVPSARPVPMITSEFFRFVQERSHVAEV